MVLSPDEIAVPTNVPAANLIVKARKGSVFTFEFIGPEKIKGFAMIRVESIDSNLDATIEFFIPDGCEVYPTTAKSLRAIVDAAN